jgi:hypothetical protein
VCTVSKMDAVPGDAGWDTDSPLWRPLLMVHQGAGSMGGQWLLSLRSLVLTMGRKSEAGLGGQLVAADHRRCVSGGDRGTSSHSWVGVSNTDSSTTQG